MAGEATLFARKETTHEARSSPPRHPRPPGRRGRLGAGHAAGPPGVRGPVRSIRGGREVEFPATVSRKAFERELLGLGMPGYHLIVWKDGRAATAALFRAEVTDVQVLDALESLGARPGNALGMATWDERKDSTSRRPTRSSRARRSRSWSASRGGRSRSPSTRSWRTPAAAASTCVSAATAPTSRSGSRAAWSASTPAPAARWGTRYTVRDWVKGTTRSG